MPLGSPRGSPQWGAGHARRDPAAGRSDVQTKSPARAATSLALIAWCRRRSPPPDAANDFLLNRKKVMPRRPPPSRVRGRVARTHHSPFATHHSPGLSPPPSSPAYSLAAFLVERDVVDRTDTRGKRGVWRSGVCLFVAWALSCAIRQGRAAGQRIRNAGIASTRTKRRQRGQVGGIKQAHGYAVMRQCISG